MMSKNWVLKAVMTAAVSLVICGAVLMSGCTGDDDDGEKSIVGDWRVVSTNYGDGAFDKQPDDNCVILSFKSSGEFVTTEAQNVGDFWIEWTESTQYHVTGSGFYIVEQYWDGDVKKNDTTNARYKINGSKLNLTRCFRDQDEKNESCEESELTKVNLADVRKSLGTVYTPNPAIKGYWILREDGEDWFSNEWLSLDSKYFDGGYKYIPDAEYSDGYWCTNGNKLILVDDEDYTVRVELEYSLSGSGSNKKLTINGDEWELDDDFQYKAAASK